MNDPAYLDAAHRIAATLCRDAVRAGDRCNWLGDAVENINGQMRTIHRSFGGDLYGGTSGIALFLAEADRFRPDPLLRSTARAAIEHALRDADSSIGFYHGASGIGYAAARIGELTEDETLVERGLELIERITAVSDESPIDVLTGAAGTIGPLLALHAKYKRDWMIDRALAAGDLVVRRARANGNAVSWNVLGEEWASADLTGYAHGAAGFALALFELVQATGEQRFAAAAEGALRYERALFSPQQQNWPDFRRAAPGVPQQQTSYALGWCHGAPGIGLARLRLYKLTRRPDVWEEATAALRGTYSPLASLAPASMFVLCHGATGNAELFIDAGEVLGEAGYTAIAEAIGKQGIERFHAPRRPWPSGLTTGGQTPGLMLGLAGIGYFYLRLYDSASVPSLLVVGPSSA